MTPPRQLKPGSPIRRTMYGSVSTALMVLNTFLALKGQVIVVTLDQSRHDDPTKPTDAEINQSQIQEVQVMSVTEAVKWGFSGG